MTAPPEWIGDTVLFDRAGLDRIRRDRESTPEIRPTIESIRDRANKLVQAEAPTVTKTETLPPSGDPHDYLSQARYWWPNPDTEDGLPYVERDGKSNPEIYELDRPRVTRLVDGVEALTLAAYLTGSEEYAENARRFLRTWFLDPETRMNPHLEYAARIPGRTEGAGFGVLDTRDFRLLVDYIRLLAYSGMIESPELDGLRTWFDEFATWLLESENGEAAATYYNNHAPWYDAQLVPILLFVGREELAGHLLRYGRILERHIVAHITPQGDQPAETARERPLHYSVFNLRALCSLATVAESFGRNAWSFDMQGRSLKAAIDRVVSALETHEWGKNTAVDDIDQEEVFVVLLRAAEAFSKPKYRKTAQSLPDIEAHRHPRWLLHPPSEAR